MKVKELLEKLSSLPANYLDAEVKFNVEGRYEYHNLLLRIFSQGYSSDIGQNVSFSFEYINKPDEVKRGENLREVAKKLKISFPVYEEMPEDYEDFSNFVKKSNQYSKLEFVVNLNDHSIFDWKNKNGRAGYLFYKIVDTGTYTLLDENDKVVAEINGYVPNKLIPEANGYGDYIELKINPDGIIVNWSEDDSFHEFLK